MLVAAILLLAAEGDPAWPEPPSGPLICRYETFVSRVISHRKLCLTEAEWDKRDRQKSEASRRSLYELMGNTACTDGGLCTD